MKRPEGFDASRPVEPVEAPKKPRKVVRAPVRTAEVEQEAAPAEANSQLPVAGDIGEHPTVELFADTWEASATASEAPATAAATAEDEASAEDPIRLARRNVRLAERERRRREKREQRRFTAHARRRRRAVFAGLAVVLGLALFVVLGVYTPIMSVNKIEVTGANTVSEEELTTALQRFEGVPLALVEDQDVHRALESFPLIQRYSIQRIPPHTLVVSIEEREAVIAFKGDGNFELVDPAGVLLGTAEKRPTGVPVGKGEVTDLASVAFREAAIVVRDMPEDVRTLLRQVEASNAQDITFRLKGGIEVVWGDSSLTQRKAVVLLAMLDAVKDPSFIDLSAPDAPVFQ